MQLTKASCHDVRPGSAKQCHINAVHIGSLCYGLKIAALLHVTMDTTCALCNAQQSITMAADVHKAIE